MISQEALNATYLERQQGGHMVAPLSIYPIHTKKPLPLHKSIFVVTNFYLHASSLTEPDQRKHIRH